MVDTNKGGRPTLPPELRRDKREYFQVSEEEKSEIRRRAREAHMTVSDYIRRKILE